MPYFASNNKLSPTQVTLMSGNLLERKTGLEPATSCLGSRHSTIELHPQDPYSKSRGLTRTIGVFPSPPQQSIGGIYRSANFLVLFQITETTQLRRVTGLDCCSEFAVLGLIPTPLTQQGKS